MRVFHISVSWWFLTEVWVIACLFKSPGIFSVFRPIIIIIIILFIWEIFTIELADGVFFWILSESKTPQVSTTLLSILADLNNAVDGWVSTCPLISKSSSPCTNTLVTVLSAPIITGITVTFTFHSFSSSLAKSRYLFLFLLSFSFILRVYYSAIFLFFFFFFFFFFLLSLGLVVWLRLEDPFVSQNPREVYASHFSGQMLGCTYTICSCGQI